MPRQLLPQEAKMHEAALNYLLRTFTADMSGLSPEQCKAMRVTDWILAADFYVRHYQAMILEYDFGDQETGFGAELPPVWEAMKPTKLEDEVFEAASELLCAAFGMPTQHEHALTAPVASPMSLESSI